LKLNINDTGHIAPTRPAATVILLREGRDDVDVLMLHRNKALAFAGGLWVFPGGAIDQGDIDAASGDIASASANAALREAKEESGLEVDAASMVPLSFWTTPVVEKKRFHTAFFVAKVDGSDRVSIDGGEIQDAEWIGIDQAINKHRAGELGLLPPTLMTLKQLSGFGSVEATLSAVKAAPTAHIAPVVAMQPTGPIIMFAGDAGIAEGDASVPGNRNRCELIDKHWTYLYSDGGVRVDRL